METQIIFGPPGTGKTETLLRTVEQELKRGVAPNRISYLGFTRQAAYGAKRRAVASIGCTYDELPWFRTLHSTACRQLRLRSSELLPTEYLQDMSALNLPWQNTEVFEAVRILDIALNTHQSIEDVIIQRFTTRLGRKVQCVNPEQIPRIVQAILDVKRKTGRYTYPDLIRMHCPPLPVEVVMVDEAQDLTRLEWEFVFRVAANCERMYIAGDDDQAIFGWKGASAANMLTLSGEHIHLRKSYRVPLKVKQFSDNILQRIRRREPKHWEPTSEDGLVVRSCAELGTYAGLPGSWLFLARTEQALVRLLPHIRGLNKAYSFRGKNHGEDPIVRADTIHAAKGAEADNVVLSLEDFGERIEMTDEDHRIAYVAMTRARKNMFIMSPAFNRIPRSYDIFGL